MTDERRDAAEDQGQMKDQESFSEDPREGKDLSEQQGESQPADSGTEGSDSGSGSGSGDSPDRDDEQGQTGRDDPGQSTGNPADAG
jgi:hypothetical protein